MPKAISKTPETKAQSAKGLKNLPQQKDKREKLILLSLSSFKKFDIFNDVEIGITNSLQNKLK